KSLVMFAHEQGRVSKPEQSDGHSEDGDGIGVDTVYSDPSGGKVGIAVVINKDHGKSIDMISQPKGLDVDKLIVLTNARTAGSADTTVVNIDRCKMIDLIYFGQKYKNEDIVETDSDRALMLAKAICLC
ncbi:MAG: hypothetical protein ACE5JV_01375, partial [Nitrososphaerales archaeon]